MLTVEPVEQLLQGASKHITICGICRQRVMRVPGCPFAEANAAEALGDLGWLRSQAWENSSQACQQLMLPVRRAQREWKQPACWMVSLSVQALCLSWQISHCVVNGPIDFKCRYHVTCTILAALIELRSIADTPHNHSKSASMHMSSLVATNKMQGTPSICMLYTSRQICETAMSYTFHFCISESATCRLCTSMSCMPWLTRRHQHMQADKQGCHFGARAV